MLSLNTFGQSNNVFLDRNYWKENPSKEKIKEDIGKGNDIAELNSNKFDGVVYAILQDVSNPTIEFILSQKGNEVNKLTHDARTYVFWAAYKNNVDLMRYLIKKGAKMNLVDQYGLTVANFAASNGQLNPEIYELCEKAGCILKQELNPDGANALLLAMPFIETMETLNFFLKRGMAITDADKKGNNAFVYAAKSGNKFMMDYCISQKIDPKANADAAIIFACAGIRNKKNGVATFHYLIEKGLSPNAMDENGNNVFHLLSAYTSDFDLLNYFVDYGVNINGKNNNGQTPLHIAISKNKKEIVDYYLQMGTNLDMLDDGGNSVLHLAAEGNDPKLMQVLLEKFKNINAVNKDGMTALHLAAMKGENLEMIKLLLAAGADKTIKTQFDETAFDLASENEMFKKAKLDITILK
jgi:ankyrin repeat protein